MSKSIVINIDESMSDAGQIARVIGTMNRKGHHTERQPHRRSRLLSVPEAIVTLSSEQLQAVAAFAPATQAKPGGSATRGTTGGGAGSNGHAGAFSHRLKVGEWLAARGQTYRVKPEPDNLGRTVYVLSACPFNPSHGDPDSCVMQGADGQLAAQSFHHSCSGRGWQEFKAAIGPPDADHYDPPLSGRGTASTNGTAGPSPTAPPEDGDWTARAKEHQAAQRPEHRTTLAKRLKLPEAALAGVQLGWLDAGDKSCCTVPEVDGEGNVVGIVRLCDDGEERPMAGGKRGVVLPAGWEQRGGPATGTPTYVVPTPTDAVALSAAGLSAVSVPHRDGVAQLEAHLRRLPEPRCVMFLGDDPKVKERAAVLRQRMTDWPVRWCAVPKPHPTALAWVQSFSTDVTLADAWGELGDKLLQQIDGRCHEAGEDGSATAGRKPYTFDVVDSRTFAAADYRLNWLIRWLIASGQPILLGGPSKTLKTSIVVDLVVSLGSGMPFLGVEDFRAYRKVTVAILSGESGEAVLQETARRICAAKGVNLADLSVYWGFRLPQLASPADVSALADGLKVKKIEVLVIDPAYLCLLAGVEGKEINAANMFQIGPLLMSIDEACKSASCTPILIHHTRKNLQAPYEPLEMQDLAFAGFQEFARQWLLINRRRAFEPGTGRHELWMSVGGSEGQGGQWAIDVNEGTLREDFGGRIWEVTVNGSRDVRQAAADERQERKDKAEETKLVLAIEQLAGEQRGAVVGYTKARALAKLNNDAMLRVVARLEKAGRVRQETLKRTVGSNAKRDVAGIRLVYLDE